MIQYQQDYDDVYPASSGNTLLPSGSYGPTPGWAMQVYPYVKSFGVYLCPDDQVVRSTYNFPGTNVTVPSSYAMPDEENGGKYGCSYTSSMQCAGMAGYYGSSNSAWNSWNASQIQSPSTTLMLAEFYSSYNRVPAYNYSDDYVDSPTQKYPCNWVGNSYLQRAYYSIQPQDAFTNGVPAHSGGWNYAFADGHVKWLQPQQTMGSKTSCYASVSQGIAIMQGMWSVNSND